MTQVPANAQQRYYSPDEASCKPPSALMALEPGAKQLSVSIVSVIPSVSDNQHTFIVKVRLKNNTDRGFEIPNRTEPVLPKPSKAGGNIMSYRTAQMAFSLSLAGQPNGWEFDTGAMFWASYANSDDLTYIAPNHWIDILFKTSINCAKNACERYAAGEPMELEGEWYEETISLEPTRDGCVRGSFNTRDVRTERIPLEKPQAEQRPLKKTTAK